MSHNLSAFLRLIREGESNQDDTAYRTQVGGRILPTLDDHPREKVTLVIKGKHVVSSAAGAYQFLERTWDECAKALGLTDFSPSAQDAAAVFLIKRRGALEDVEAGRLELAIEKCNREWASLPGDRYGQGGMSMEKARAVFQRWGGVIDAPVEQPIPAGEVDYQPKVKPMAPIIAALLPSIIEAIPKLGQLFGSGSKVAERNVKAAEAVVEIVKNATGAVNAQDAAEKIRSDPAALQAATAAVESNWYTLTEAGSGGIDAARKADAAMSGGDMLHSPSFWVAIALLPLVYMIVGSVVGLFGAPWSEDVRSAIANGVVGMVIGAIAGYYFGQTTSRNRTPAP